MYITLDYEWIIDALLIILCIALFLKNCNYMKQKQYNQNYLNKENTNALRGLAVLTIFIHHTVRHFTQESVLKTIFINAGFLAVAIFLFVSGYALMEQSSKRKDYLKGFFFNKIIKIYAIFVGANIIVTILDNIFLHTNYSIMNIITSSLKMNFSDGRSLWFVFIILYFYMAFFLSRKYLKSNKQVCISLLCFSLVYIAGFCIMKKGTWWYNTAICFPIGCVVQMNKEKILQCISKNYLIHLLASIILFGSTMYLYQGMQIMWLQFIMPIIFIYMIVCVCMKIQLKSKVLETVNKMSFEIYLLQLVILNIIFQKNETKSFIWYIVSLGLIVVLSYGLNKGINFIFKKANYVLEKIGEKKVNEN